MTMTGLMVGYRWSCCWAERTVNSGQLAQLAGKWNPLGQIQIKVTIRIHVEIKQGRESAPIRFRHAIILRGFG